MTTTVNLDALTTAYLKRIADALDRAFPKEKSDGKLSLGVAKYDYDSEQTKLLREIAQGAQDPTSDGSAQPI